MTLGCLFHWSFVLINLKTTFLQVAKNEFLLWIDTRRMSAAGLNLIGFSGLLSYWSTIINCALKGSLSVKKVRRIISSLIASWVPMRNISCYSERWCSASFASLLCFYLVRRGGLYLNTLCSMPSETRSQLYLAASRSSGVRRSIVISDAARDITAIICLFSLNENI